VSAQSVASAVNSAQSEPAPETSHTSTNLAESARRRADQLVVRETAWARASRATAHAPREGEGAAFAVGATVGGLLGFAIAGSQCHCESGKAALFGSAVGGIGGVLLFRALTQ
jgi:hypothetical protein